MKNLFFAMTFLLTAAVLRAAGPGPKVTLAFQKDFGSTADVTWHETPGGYSAFFTRGNIPHRVKYTAAGDLVHIIRYYGEQELPSFIRSKLNKRFPDKTVFGVTEEASEEALSYRIILEGAKSWTIVRSDALGNLFVEEEQKRQPDATTLQAALR